VISQQFQDLNWFSEAEVAGTGANVLGVDFHLMLKYDKWRSNLNTRVDLLHNGLNSGDHSSEWHPKGMAGDSCTPDKEISPQEAFKAALKAGFFGIGIYWNGHAYSYHLDIGRGYRLWIAKRIIKDDGSKSWQYHSLISDPKQL